MTRERIGLVLGAAGLAAACSLCACGAVCGVWRGFIRWRGEHVLRDQEFWASECLFP